MLLPFLPRSPNGEIGGITQVVFFSNFDDKKSLEWCLIFVVLYRDQSCSDQVPEQQLSLLDRLIN